MIHPRTVGQLIKELQRLDPNAEIGVAHPTHTYHGTWTYEIIQIENQKVRKVSRHGWCLVQDGENLEPDDETKEVMVIS